MHSTTSTALISVFKSVFARFGIPEILRSDNGPQFTSAEMTEFMSSYNIKQVILAVLIFPEVMAWQRDLYAQLSS